MSKAIEFPTDTKLYLKCIKALVKTADQLKLSLRQTYKKLAPRSLKRRNCYVHARQMKRAKWEEKRLHTYLGRVIRDFERKSGNTKLDKECLFLLEVVKLVAKHQ